MEWSQMAMGWGPAIPLILYFLHMHRQLVEVQIPRAIEILTCELHHGLERAEERHREHLAAVEQIRAEMAKRKRKRTNKVPADTVTLPRSKKRYSRAGKTGSK